MNGLVGFVIGFLIGMVVNAFLLRGVDKSRYLNDKKLRLKYGALNWALALAGLLIGLTWR